MVHSNVGPPPPTFRKLRASGCGESFADVAEIARVKTRPLKASEVLIRVVHAGVNGGCETFRARCEQAFSALRDTGPFDLGAEGVGLVVAKGSRVKQEELDVDVGDAVAFIGGAFSEYVYARAQHVVRLETQNTQTNQTNHTDDLGLGLGPAWAALVISGVTAGLGVEVVGAVRKGDVCLVTAAAGGTGHFAVQFAKRNGAHVVATCGGREKAARLQGLGVDRVIDYTEEDVAEVLAREYNGKLDLVYEVSSICMHIYIHRHVGVGRPGGWVRAGEDVRTVFLKPSHPETHHAIFLSYSYFLSYLIGTHDDPCPFFPLVRSLHV